MSKIRICSVLLCMLLLLALAACNESGEVEQTTPEITTEITADPVTDAPETEQPTTAETTTEQVTTEPATEPETELLGRDDYADDDPNNPYLNLIAVGTSYDGVTTCYDGRYDFGYTVCSAGGMDFSSVQDAIDYLSENGGNVSIKADIGICLRLIIPDDGEFYRIFYNCKNCDFVFNYGVVYDDQKADPNTGIFGYAYYSDLYELDYITGLDYTYVWIYTDHEGFAPGRYLMIPGEGNDDFYYGYDKTEEVFEWPGLPLAEVLPE